MAESQPTPQLRSLVDSAQRAIADASARRGFELPYAAPDRRPNPVADLLDGGRAALSVLAAVFLLFTALAYSPVSGGRANSSLLDTGLVHTVLWPVIAAGLLVGALLGALPRQLSARRQRATALQALCAAALMALALTLAAAFLAWTAALAATASTLLALSVLRELNRHTARTALERASLDVPWGFFAGFALVYTLQLWCAAAGWNDPAHALAASLLTVAACVPAAVLAHSERGRHSLAAGFALAILAAAVQGWLRGSTPLWACALWALLAIVVFICAENRRFQISHAEHRTQAGKELDF